MTPFLTILQSTPYIILAPLLMIWFGIGIFPKILIIIMSCSFPIVVIVLDALIKSEQKYGIFSQQLELSQFKALIKIHLPYSLNGFFEGLKISVSYSYVTAILSEMMGSEKGLGVYLIYAQSSYNSNKVLACTLLIICTTLLIRSIVDKVKSYFVYWKYE
jgi:ABC-type nitrate/sulfonate/bicarbonate transport system permease component